MLRETCKFTEIGQIVLTCSDSSGNNSFANVSDVEVTWCFYIIPILLGEWINAIIKEKHDQKLS